MYVDYFEYTRTYPVGEESPYKDGEILQKGYDTLEHFYGFDVHSIDKTSLHTDNQDEVGNFYTKLADSFMFMNLWRLITVTIKSTCGVLSVFNFCKRANIKSLYLWSWVSNMFFLYDISMMIISFSTFINLFPESNRFFLLKGLFN